ncbi:hypothetical protein NOCARDAX2BIS_220111 [Nocardioides sp. AX2bis]|nr:hypothetical protein NOCARDAX2BIS_220111 [Nocardioides sp. AX2bis]
MAGPVRRQPRRRLQPDHDLPGPDTADRRRLLELVAGGPRGAQQRRVRRRRGGQPVRRRAVRLRGLHPVRLRLLGLHQLRLRAGRQDHPAHLGRPGRRGHPGLGGQPPAGRPDLLLAGRLGVARRDLRRRRHGLGGAGHRRLRAVRPDLGRRALVRPLLSRPLEH